MEFVDGAGLPDRGQCSARLGAADQGTDRRSGSPMCSPSCTRSTRQSVGLADFGRPDGYLERQLRRWQQAARASRSRELPGIDELHDAAGEEAARVVEVVDRARRLPPRQRIVDSRATTDRSRARLGDVHARRSSSPTSACCSCTGAADHVRGLFGDPPPGAPSSRGAGRAVRRASAGATWPARLVPRFRQLQARGDRRGHPFPVPAPGKTVGEGFDRIGALVPRLIAQGHDAAEGGNDGLRSRGRTKPCSPPSRVHGVACLPGRDGAGAAARDDSTLDHPAGRRGAQGGGARTRACGTSSAICPTCSTPRWRRSPDAARTWRRRR